MIYKIIAHDLFVGTLACLEEPWVLNQTYGCLPVFGHGIGQTLGCGLCKYIIINPISVAIPLIVRGLSVRVHRSLHPGHYCFLGRQ